MPTLTEIRAAIKAKIEGVGGVGVVHDYERYAKEAGKYRQLYVSGNPARVLGFHIRRLATREFLEDIARWRVVHVWRIRGFMGVDDADATEKLFDDKIEQIRDAFRADDTLGGILFSCIDPQSDEVGIQVLEHGHVLMADVLCHDAKLGLTTQHLL